MSAALALSTPREESLVAGDFLLTQADFDRLRQLLHDDAGIYLPEAKVALLYSRLGKRLRALHLTSFRAYCERVAEDAAERREMLAALTTNVTRFFREPHHFGHLQRLLPAWREAAQAGARIRLWSAACSSGQEPYSMAMTLLSAWPEAAAQDVRILATDIDPVVLAKAEEGAYAPELLQEVPEELKRKYFRRDGEVWRANDALRKLVVFNELNLIGDWPMKGRFQAIFCRNVAIYFDGPTQDRLWSRFADILSPDGRLYIGHSERATDPRLETDGLTVYNLKGGPAR